MKPAVLLCLLRGVDTLAEALLERADLEIITLYDLSSEVLARKGIAHRRFNDFLGDRIRQDAPRQAEERGRLVARGLATDEMARAWGRLDGPTWSAFRAEVMNAVRRDFVEEIIIVDVLRRCLCETDLRLVIVSEDICRDTKTTLSAANRLGVPSLHILHGYMYGTTNAHDTITADVIAAYSERSKRTYVSFGAEPERVVVTGNPFWDIYARPPRPGFKERACANLGLDPNRPIIEYAMTHVHRFSAVSIRHPAYHLRTSEVVLDAFAQLAPVHPDWQFILRPHPGHHNFLEQLKERTAPAALRTLYVDFGTPYDSVVAADVLLCTHSNLGIEAILLGKPVVNVAIDELAGPVFREGVGELFFDDDAVLWARTADEIAPAIEAAVVDPATRERLLALRPASIEHFNYRNDGRAMERTCSLVLDMIDHNRRYVRPIARFPDVEPALARAIPAEARSVLVAGHAARFVADAVSAAHPQAVIRTCQTIELGDGLADAVVLADPLPHSAAAESRLRKARSLASPGGVVVAAFRHGANDEAVEALAEGRWVPARPGADAPVNVREFAWTGVEIVLSRCQLEPVNILDVANPAYSPRAGEPSGLSRAVDAWVVAARGRSSGLSEYGRTRRENRRRADAANQRGEALYAQGDVMGAVNEFAVAINDCSDVALYYNNLAAGLHALGHSEEAWERLLEALNLDPTIQFLRDNARMVAAALDKSDQAEDLLARFGADSTPNP